MKNVREMTFTEFREYLKNDYHYTDTFLDGKIEIAVIDLLKLLEVNGELLEIANLEE